MTGAMQMKASDQVKNVFSKKAPDVVVKEASTSAVAPNQTARKYESYGDEFTRKELVKARSGK
jgi:dTDP-4-dehydrorhamnose reductase